MIPTIHHVSIINRYIVPSFEFYHNILGLKLLMKTVNQDDTSMYHLFFSDEQGRPGTEFTVFEMTEGKQRTFGTNAIERTVFKVPSEHSLDFWEKRFDAFDVCHYGKERYNGRPILRFEGPDGTGLGLVAMKEQESLADFRPPAAEDIPEAHRILGIDSVHLRVHYSEATKRELETLLGWSVKGETPFFDTPFKVTVLTNNDDRLNQEVHIIHDNQSPVEEQGIGSIHHVAFGVPDRKALDDALSRVQVKNFRHSPIKNREFFQSLYYREPNQLLIEIATNDGYLAEHEAGAADAFDTIPLYLPTFLEPQRRQLERQLAESAHTPL
ncbi:VOC family protein [Vagococcus acidifermentans]|uniref:VOC family protein n=1 Tax=Vagococcus acidifermentans TaxID=564710 RepID=UPI000F887BA1|nr:VOC family protein [Vagococcus acidifermentans]